MSVIYKYRIPVADEFELSLHVGTRFLDVQIQQGVPCLWAMIDKRQSEVIFRFHMLGTGHEINADTASDLQYIATFQDGSLVWHLFVEPT